MIVSGSHRQQQEQEGRGFHWLWPGVAPVAAAVLQSTLLVVPTQPTLAPQAPVLLAGPRPGNVAPPPQIAASIFVRQEQPAHPSPITFAGVPPSSAPQTALPLITRQEQPDHPLSRLLRGVQPNNVAAPPQVRTLVTVQEIPLLHPAPYTFAGVPPLTQPVSPGRRMVITAQELPLLHPMPLTLSAIGIAPPPPPTDIQLIGKHGMVPGFPMGFTLGL